MLERLKKIFGNLEEYFVAFFLTIMVISVFLATVGRYTGLFSMPWADELSRYLCVWVVFLGIGAGARHNAHFIVDILPTMLSPKHHRWQRIFVTVFVVFFMGVLVYYSGSMVSRIIRMNQISASMRIPMWTVYIAIPIGCFLMAIRTVQACVENLKMESAAGPNPEDEI
ncbi:MAG: TRAP transporter small permease [Planctomycetaceae bacterium]|nr:TRAP transporter small permease [Planctomycetaceae bacterium]